MGLRHKTDLEPYARELYPTLMKGCLTLIVVVLVAAVGPVMLCVTVWRWLQTSEWDPVENMWLLDVSPDLREWLIDPRSWFGLHKIAYFAFKYIPFGMISLPIAYMILTADLDLEPTKTEGSEQDPTKRDS